MATTSSSSPLPAHSPTPALLRVKGLSKKYVRGGALRFWRKRDPVIALNRVNFELQRGQTLALVGQSGSGKSTLARCVTRLEKPDAGEILFHGVDIAQLNQRELFPFRSRIQMVFQDSVTSMNPRFSALDVIEEPLLIAGPPDEDSPRQSRATRRDLVRALMNEVGLSPDWVHRSILHFSGGQRQRLALARALVVRPQLLVLDEALSGLDVSTQAQIANLLLDLQTAHSLTYLLISHDLALATRFADAIGVIFEGQVVEVGSPAEIISRPLHSATRKLVESALAAASPLATVTISETPS